jgi:hypothetical protein
MRNITLLGGIGILSITAWTVVADDGNQALGKTHARPGSGQDYHMTHRSGHFIPLAQTWIFLPTPPEHFISDMETGPAPVMPDGGLVAGSPEHTRASHLVGPASYLHTHNVVHVLWVDASIPQPTAPGGAAPGQADAATAQPDPSAGPLSPRPPGATGPGLPRAGWSGPGLPGPGRPAGPGW